MIYFSWDSFITSLLTVMFRQTFIRACINRGITAGASNDKLNKSRVTFTMIGPSDKIEEIISFMSSGKPLNSWGAKFHQVNELTHSTSGMDLHLHQVTTDNVHDYNWSMYTPLYSSCQRTDHSPICRSQCYLLPVADAPANQLYWQFILDTITK